MSNVFIDIGVSLDGYMAGPNAGPNNPLGDNGMAIHQWMFKQKSFLEHLGLPGGETDNPNDTLIAQIFDRAGASILGKRMFEEGEVNWPEEAPFRTPVFVLTHEVRQPWERPGGTTFYFVNDGIHSALERAKEAAGDRDVRISGGSDTISQYLHAGLVDELNLHIAPMLLGKGLRCFDHFDTSTFSLEVDTVTSAPDVTHLRYRILR